MVGATFEDGEVCDSTAGMGGFKISASAGDAICPSTANDEVGIVDPDRDEVSFCPEIASSSTVLGTTARSRVW